jgi:hypothetical protein
MRLLEGNEKSVSDTIANRSQQRRRDGHNLFLYHIRFDNPFNEGPADRGYNKMIGIILVDLFPGNNLSGALGDQANTRP